MLERDWQPHRCEQEGAGSTGASDASASRVLNGSKDGSLHKWCEGFDQLSRSRRQRQLVVWPTSALHAALDVLVRASLPARLTFAEGPHVHCSMDAGASMSSLTESDVLEIENWWQQNKKNKNFLVSHLQKWTRTLSIQEDRDIREIGDHELVTEEVGVTAQHEQKERAHAPSTRHAQFCCDREPHVSGKAFRVRPGVRNFQLRRHQRNLGRLTPSCLEYRGHLCMRAAISVLPRWCCAPSVCYPNRTNCAQQHESGRDREKAGKVFW